ncbi:MAG: hypothetical protein QOH91_1756, partial [Mycobacterium sp.]|nr:hypothetical protein [Mycobacterium sp.]
PGAIYVESDRVNFLYQIVDAPAQS